MARWRLRNAHYLNAERDGMPTEWEHRETNRDTGRQARKVYIVPLYMDPNNPQDQTPQNSGEIIVCHKDKGERHDIIFFGEPTPDMEPVDEEAEKLSAELAPKWQHPIESLGANGLDYGQQLLQSFEKQLTALINGQKAAVPNVGGIDAKAFEALQARVEELAKANAELMAKLVEKPARRA